MDTLGNTNSVTWIVEFFGKNNEFVSPRTSKRGFSDIQMFWFSQTRPRNSIGTAEAGAQTLRDQNEESVTSGVSQTVIHYFESVDINTEDSKLECRMTMRNDQRAAQPIEK